MLPYFEAHLIPLGPVNIQVWGLLAATGIAAAVLTGRREARRRGLDPERFIDFAAACVLGGLIGARMFYALVYEPAATIEDPLSIIKVWQGGMSMFGGLLGGALAAWISFRRDPGAFAQYADVTAYVIPLGYGIARIGCFLIHDHPGTLSNSILAVNYPGGARYDLGLLQMLVGFGIFLLFLYLSRRAEKQAKAPPSFLRLFLICYGLSRFALDFLRATDLPTVDARYYGLTPAQYLSLAFVAVGLFAFRKEPWASSAAKKTNSSR
jgi:phosphatidylglycerol---prolipoprotein diacylglyceryl transferase